MLFVTRYGCFAEDDGWLVRHTAGEWQALSLE